MSIYPIAATTPSAKDSNTAGNTNSTATDYQQTFMKLLATELQSQDPTQTIDPTTMVTQMVQINQLSDVAGIYSILQGGTSGANAGAAAGTNSSASQSARNIVGGN